MKCDRRTFLFLSSTALCSLALTAAAENPPTDPWSSTDLMEPAELAGKISDSHVHLLCVGFPQLYRKHRISHAQFAGPVSQPDGLKALQAAAARLPKNEEVVIYCGCCPMKDCPNIRPAYTALKSNGFENVKVLNLPRNLRLDWTEKGYPVEG